MPNDYPNAKNKVQSLEFTLEIGLFTPLPALVFGAFSEIGATAILTRIWSDGGCLSIVAPPRYYMVMGESLVCRDDSLISCRNVKTVTRSGYLKWDKT